MTNGFLSDTSIERRMSNEYLPDIGSPAVLGHRGDNDDGWKKLSSIRDKSGEITDVTPLITDFL